MRHFLHYLLLLTLVFGCTYTTKVTDGATAIDRKQYSVAIPLLKKEYNRAKLRSEKGKIAANLALAYDRTGKDEEASDWYQKAYDNGGGTDALRGRAASLKRLERYDDAIQAYTDLGLELGSRYEFRNDILGSEKAQEWLAEEFKAYEVNSADFNSARSDYAPVPYADGQLVITSDRNEATGDETYAWTGGGFTDLFLVDPRSNSVDGFDPTVNTPSHEGVPAFSSDFQEMFFTRCEGAKREDAFCALYLSRREGNGWGLPERLPFQDADVNYLHPALSDDGNILYFSALTEDGWGGYDIFAVIRGVDGTWGEPAPMNRAINTQGNEQFPFVDGDTLYFASDGHVGMGGLDIFKTWKLPNGRWAAVQNLKPPLNSGGDDFAYFMTEEVVPDGIVDVGFFTSNRPGGSGSDDIYRYERRPLPPPPPIDTTQPIVYRDVLDVYVVEKIYADPGNPNSRIMGRRPMENASLTIQLRGKERTVNTNEEGLLSLILIEDAEYRFLAEKEGYLAQDAEFNSTGLPRDPSAPEQRYDLEIELDQIFSNQEIVLENIYYDFDESFIRDDAKPSLDELVDIMSLNEEVYIELGSHTDCRGPRAYNQSLSQRRAQSAVQYLIDNGISSERLRAKGYGAEEPAVDCLCARCTEDEHQRNRRTTFRILEN